MKFRNAIAAGAALVALTACTDPAHLGGSDPNKNTKQGAILGGILGAGVGALASKDKKKGALIGGVLGAATGAVAGNFLDKQEAELRRDLGSGVLHRRVAVVCVPPFR